MNIIIRFYFYLFELTYVIIFIYTFVVFVCVLDIDGQEDMKLICGIIVVEDKDKVEKGDKVSSFRVSLLAN